MTTSEDFKTIEAVLENRATPQEAERVAEWFATEEGQAHLAKFIEREFQMLESGEKPLYADIPSEEIYRRVKRFVHRRTIRMWAMRVAAVLIPIMIVIASALYVDNIIGGIFSPSEKIVQNVARGDKMHIVFQDGTSAWLNAGSKISYPSQFDLTSRMIELDGEAYLDVASNPMRPFIIKFEGGEVRVKGTSFNIKAYSQDENVSVALIDGAIELASDGKLYTLRPSDLLELNRADGTIKITHNSQIKHLADWRSNRLSFYGASLKEVTSSLSRIYDVEFKFGNEPIEQLLYTFTTPQTSLDSILRELEYISPLRFSREGDIVYILKKNSDK